MKNLFLSLAILYGIGMGVYGSAWYLKDIKQLESAVRTGNEHVEMRHRINTWGNVGLILLANLMTIVAITGLETKKQNCNSLADKQ